MPATKNRPVVKPLHPMIQRFLTALGAEYNHETCRWEMYDEPPAKLDFDLGTDNVLEGMTRMMELKRHLAHFNISCGQISQHGTKLTFKGLVKN